MIFLRISFKVCVVESSNEKNTKVNMLSETLITVITILDRPRGHLLAGNETEGMLRWQTD